MKTLVLAIILMSFPWLSYAKGGGHSNHDHYYERNHNNSYFWQDVQHRQHRQASRIERGIYKGQLTRREVKKLHREQRHVAKQIRHYKHNHYIGSSKKRRIMEHLDYVSEKIRDFKHNDRYARRNRSNHHGHNHHGHNHQSYTHGNKRNYYRNEGYLSKANNDYSAGLYFRF